MQPDEVPETKTLAGSAPKLATAQLTMLARPLLSPPPLWVRVCLVATSQQLLSRLELGYRTTKPLDSARGWYLDCEA